VHRNGDFLWHPEMQAAPLRDRSELPNASKKLEFVASEEIEAAIGKVVTDAYGIDREEIPGAVLRLLLGFKRATEVAQRQVTKVLDGMIAQGRLIEENNHVSVKE
jgi:hypothetical protein